MGKQDLLNYKQLESMIDQASLTLFDLAKIHVDKFHEIRSENIHKDIKNGKFGSAYLGCRVTKNPKGPGVSITWFHYIYYGEFSTSIAYPLAGAGIALVMIYRLDTSTILRYLLIITILYFGYLILMNVGARSWGKGSENHVSVFILTMTIIYYLSQIIAKKNINPIFAFIALIIAIYAQGRGGILSTGILFFGVLFIKYTNRIVYFVVLMFMCYIGYYLLQNQVEYLFNVIFLSIFDRPILEDPRMVLNAMYLERLNLNTLIFGSKGYGSIFSYNVLGLTTHNSYISIHATYGIFIIPIMCLFGLSMFRNWNRNNYLIIITIAILIRSFTDSILITSGIEFTTLLMIILSYTDYSYRR